MGIMKMLGSIGGDTWSSPHLLAVWPWPAVIIGTHGLPGERITEDDYRFFTSNLLPGDFIITRSKGFFLSNRAIPGAFKHLAVYVGGISGTKDRETSFINKPRWLGLNYTHTGKAGLNIHERCIAHAISEGVVCQDLLKLLSHCDYAGIVRSWRTPEEASKIVEIALGRVGLPYNFDFTPEGPPASYCTELGMHCLQKSNIKKLPRTTEVGVGFFKKADIPLADNFAEMFGLVAISMSCSDQKFYNRSAVGDILRQLILSSKDASDVESGS